MAWALRYLGLGESSGIQDRFIGHDYVNILANMLLRDFADGLGVRFAHMDEFQFATAQAVGTP